ncbi:MAG: hypothetical protein H6713_29740 [Myxococcales bacterium]|nr:hypothetical protein [Myxococcales bacterium]
MSAPELVAPPTSSSTPQADAATDASRATRRAAWSEVTRATIASSSL